MSTEEGGHRTSYAELWVALHARVRRDVIYDDRVYPALWELRTRWDEVSEEDRRRLMRWAGDR